MSEAGPQAIRLQKVSVLSNTCTYGLSLSTSGLVDMEGIKVANNTLSAGLRVYSNDSSSRAIRREITDNTGGGSGLSASSGSGMLISNAVVSGNAGYGINVAELRCRTARSQTTAELESLSQGQPRSPD